MLHASSQDATLPLNSPKTVAPGVKVRSWPAHPLAWVSLSVAAVEGGHKALVNSIVGTTMLVDYATGEVLGTKNAGEKAQGSAATIYSEPGTLRIAHPSPIPLLTLLKCQLGPFLSLLTVKPTHLLVVGGR